MAAALDLDLVRLAVARLESEPARLEAEAAELEPTDPAAAAAIRDGIVEVPTIEQALQLGESQPPRLPAVVIALVADDYDVGAAPTAGAYQRATATLGVWHVVASVNTPRAAGGPTVDPMARFVGYTRGSLEAWLPEGVHRASADPLRLRRGRLVGISAGRAVWLDEYAFAWRPPGRATRT